MIDKAKLDWLAMSDKSLSATVAWSIYDNIATLFKIQFELSDN